MENMYHGSLQFPLCMRFCNIKSKKMLQIIIAKLGMLYFHIHEKLGAGIIKAVNSLENVQPW